MCYDNYPKVPVSITEANTWPCLKMNWKFIVSGHRTIPHHSISLQRMLLQRTEMENWGTLTVQEWLKHGTISTILILLWLLSKSPTVINLHYSEMTLRKRHGLLSFQLQIMNLNHYSSKDVSTTSTNCLVTTYAFWPTDGKTMRIILLIWPSTSDKNCLHKMAGVLSRTFKFITFSLLKATLPDLSRTKQSQSMIQPRRRLKPPKFWARPYLENLQG